MLRVYCKDNEFFLGAAPASRLAVLFFLEEGADTGETDGMTNGSEASEVKTRKAIFCV